MRSWGFVAVFVVADVLVLTLAWQRMHHPPVAAAASAVTDPSASASPTSDEVRGPLLLAATDGGAVLRVTRGSCDSRSPVTPQAWVAAKQDAPLTRSEVPGLQEALGLYVTDNALRVVGADSSCALHGWTSTDGGATWKQGSVPSRVWYLDTDTTKAAIRGPVPGGVQNLDCTPVSVTTLDKGARALVSCSGSDLLVVSDNPTTAAISYSVSSPVAAAGTASGLPLVLAESDTCTAQLSRISSQQEAAALACLSHSSAPLGLAVSGSRVLAQVGQKLLVSDDLGGRFRDYPDSSG